MRHSKVRLLKYLAGARATAGGSAASLVHDYLTSDGASKHAVNVPTSQRYFYEKKIDSDCGLSQRHQLIQLRLGAAQLLASSQGKIFNHNNAHPLYYAQTSPREAGLCVPLLLALKRLRIQQLTELQGALIPLMLKGKHVIAHSETGTGKSFGIALAITNRIIRGNINYRLHTIIFVPTEELALQYDKWLRHFGGCTAQVVQAAIESVPLEAQLAKLHNVHPHVLVGTPQRLADIIRHSPAILGEKMRRKIDCVVLDEADLVLSMRVRYGRQQITGVQIVDRIFRNQRDEVPAQLVAASATVDGVTAQTLNTWVRNDKAVRLTTSFSEHTIPTTLNFYYFAESVAYPLPRLLELLLRLIFRQVERPRILLFTELRQVEPLCRILSEKTVHSIPEAGALLRDRCCGFAAPLHSLPRRESVGVSLPGATSGALAGQATPPRPRGRSGASEAARDRVALPNLRPVQIALQPGDVYVKNNSTLSRMNQGNLLIGVGDFGIGRGLHIHGVTHVILYGTCPSATHLVHCAGRTGRMGAEGDVIVLFPPASGRAVQQMCRSLELPFKPGKLEEVEALLSRKCFSTAESICTAECANAQLEAEIHQQQLAYAMEDSGCSPVAPVL